MAQHNTHSNPKRSGHSGNVCAFCKFFSANLDLETANSTTVRYTCLTAKCLYRPGTSVYSDKSACREFALSYDASRYAK